MNTKRIVRESLFCVFVIMAFFGMFQVTSKVAKAQTSTDGSVLGVPPPGIKLDGYFTKGTFTGNSATVINSNNVDIVRMANNPNQTGAIWSDNNKNYLDVTKKQTISMWMYFGVIQSEKGIPDGMAFVLQNDDRGAGAISMNGSTVNKGETLGVWGSDASSKTSIEKQAIQNSFAIEFDTNINSGTSVGNAFDSLPYSGINKFTGFGHIAWALPASAETYQKSGSGYGMIHNLGSDSLTNGNGVDFSYSKNRSNTFQDGWKHMTIEYVPNADGKTAKITYKYLDKTYYGKPLSPKVMATADINLDTFHLNGSKKLRYGFTAATGNLADITEAVVFESMPSLVDAEDNAYVVDKTTNTRISSGTSSSVTANQNVNLFSDEDNNLTTSKVAHPDDNLTLNYMLHFLSGEEPTSGVKATVNIPDNVSIAPDKDGNIGEVYYRSKPDANGNVTTESDPIDGSVLSGKTLTCDIDNLGDSQNKNWESVQIKLNVTADKLPSGATSLNVPASSVHFEGTNFIGDAQSGSFNIVKPSNTLKITTDMTDTTEVKLDDKFNLTGDISFGTPETVNKNDMYINYSIDGGPIVRSQDTSAGSKYTIYDLETGTGTGQLNVGDHTIEVQVIDNNYSAGNGVIDTIASNKLDYHIKVTNQSVTVTPDKSTITVNDNEPLTLSGTYQHADGTSTTPEGGNSVIAYTITTADGKKQAEVSSNQTNNGKYSFTLKPYAYEKDPSVSLDDYTGQTGLKVGKNTVSITVVDQDGHKSEATDVIVNVPEDTPTLTADQAGANIVQGDDINLTAKVGYSGNYQVTPSKLTWYINANGNKTINSYSGDKPVVTPLSQDITIGSTANGINDDVNNPYPISIYFTDPYGRKSETLSYPVNVMDKTSVLESTDYKFKNINASASPRVIGREGNWNLNVKSVMSKWTLTAKASPMVAGNDVTLDGSLIFVSPDNEITNMSNQTFIQRNTDDSTIKTTDIGDSWNPNQGILLDVNSSVLADTYSGKVEWDLTNSI